MQLNPVLTELGSYPLTALQEKARSLREAGKPVIDFSIGDPREPTPEFIRRALVGAVPEVSQYPTVRGIDELRHAIAAYLERRFGVIVDPATQVIPTAGAKEGIFTTPLAFVDRRVAPLVAYGTPGYPIYERGARFAGAEPSPIRLGGDFVLRAPDIPGDVWDRAALVWACTPQNPTGAVTTAADLADLVETARASATVFLSDECYADLYEDEPPASVLQVAGQEYAGVLAYFSCSKRSGMTGYRTGAIVGDADAIAALRDLRSSVGVASPEFVQSAGAAAWSDDRHAAERREIFSAKRAVLRKAFEGLGMEVVASRAGLYVWVRVEDDVVAASRLLDEGVVVSPGRSFGPGGEGYLRLALVPTVEDCRAAVEVLDRCLG